MDGVTILNEFEVVTKVAGEFNDGAAGIALLVTIIIGALIGFFIGRVNVAEFEGLMIGALVGVVLGVFIGGLFGDLFSGPVQTTTTHYEVILDDSVSMNEFYAHYNIIEHRGQIYVVEERNNNEY